MLLSPADFDAYSRATGRPVPEEPEERARLVPEITEFRRNQLKSPETQRSEGARLLEALGIGAAVLGGGALLARGLGRRGGIRMGNAQQAAKQAVQEVDVQDFGNVYRAAGRPAPSRPAPTPSRPAAAPTPTQRPAGSRQGGIQFADLGQVEGTQPKGFLRGREPGGEITQVGRRGGLADLGITETSVVDITAPAGQQALGSGKDFIAGYFKQAGTPAGYLTEARTGPSPVVAVEKVIPESLVTKQQTIAGRVVDQTANAVDAAEDQMTGRVKAQLQRNEDLDISQIDLLEEMAERDRQWMMEQDEPINQVAAQLPDGLPVDQAEGLAKSSAQSFLQRERDEIASQLGEQKIPATNTRIEQELNRRLGKEASEYGSKYTARRQALELFAKTGDPKLLEKVQRFGLSPVTFETLETMPAAKRAGFETAPAMSLDYYPSEEVTALGLGSRQNIDLPGVGNVSLADIRKPVITEGTAEQAEEFYQERKGKALDWLGDLRVKLEPQRNQILKERRALVEQNAAAIQNELNQLSASKTPNQNLINQLTGQLDNLRTLWKNPELGTHREDELRSITTRINNAKNKIAEDIASIEKRYPTTLADWSGEAPRLYGELDPDTGELIPETVELRKERPMVDLEPKGGGGRNIAEFAAGSRSATENAIREVQQGGRRTRVRDFDIETGGAAQNFEDDRTQVGRTIDEYGIRLSGQKGADVERRPSEPRYTQQEILSTALQNAKADPYGDVPVSPEYAEIMAILGTKEMPSSPKNIRVSEDVLRIQRSAPPGKAQALVNQYLNNLRGV